MRVHPPQLAAALVVGVLLGAISLLVLTRVDGNGHPASARAAPPSCASVLLRDWKDGRIDGAYPVRCYRQALTSLPTDLEVYSSAPDDIADALSRRIQQRANARTLP